MGEDSGSKAPELTSEKLDAKITVKDYDGKRKNFQSFADAVQLYFAFHEAQYKGKDRKKITFVLSKLTEGEAELWRRTYMKSEEFKSDKTGYSSFWESFEKTFKKEHEEDQALLDLHNLKQGPGESAETVITRFKHLAALAGLSLEGNDRVAIDYLRSALNPNLTDKLYLMHDEPTEFDSWARMAIKHDNVYRRHQAIKKGLGRPFNAQLFRSTTNGKKPARDPNAMDVDALTMDERKELLQKQACFYCKKPGHFA